MGSWQNSLNQVYSRKINIQPRNASENDFKSERKIYAKRGII